MAMRLLTIDDNGHFILERFAKDRIPPYAILSHRWSTDNNDEITFKEITEGINDRRKSGYKKLEFCGAQAKADGLYYFWVDTCCIDKSNQNEESVAIYSMFRWYQKAVKCYVYLADVCVGETDDQSIRAAKDLALPKSKWFTRGWTLQELLAPEIVEFYSRDGVLLGSRATLVEQIHEITGIPAAALCGKSLRDFSIEERFAWAEKRQTKAYEAKLKKSLTNRAKAKKVKKKKTDDEASQLRGWDEFDIDGLLR